MLGFCCATHVFYCLKISMVTDVKRLRAISLLMLVAGAFLLLGGVVGFASLYTASKEYESATGIVQDVQSKVEYRHRKRRYKNKMQISFPTLKYGEQRITCESYWPFRSKGDELTVWYHPDRPWESRLPGSESVLWGVLVASGVICIYGGLAVRKKKN